MRAAIANRVAGMKSRGARRCPWASLALAPALALVAVAVGCAQPGGGGPEPATCVEVAGIWDVAIDLDPQAPGTNLCRQAWSVTQEGCTIAVAEDSPCPACFIGSPLCWGASGEAPPASGSYLSLGWAWTSTCSYAAELLARTDGATLSGSMSLTERWAPGGYCLGFMRIFEVTATRR
jgi:hypothetical protein